MSDWYDENFNDEPSYLEDFDDFDEVEIKEKKKRKSSAHLRIVFDGDIPPLKQASCKAYPEPLWDLDIDKESRHTRARRHYEAKEICGGCPELLKCFSWAADRHKTNDDVRGVWGGRVFAPDTVSYPRCEDCDYAFSLAQTTRRKLRIGYVTRSTCTENQNICISCAARRGYLETPKEPNLG